MSIGEPTTTKLPGTRLEPETGCLWLQRATHDAPLMLHIFSYICLIFHPKTVLVQIEILFKNIFGKKNVRQKAFENF